MIRQDSMALKSTVLVNIPLTTKKFYLSLLNLSGKKVLVDPVFYQGSPVSFVNKMFKGTDVYKPIDMPDIDCLVISHDHWNHLDYQAVKELEPLENAKHAASESGKPVLMPQMGEVVYLE